MAKLGRIALVCQWVNRRFGKDLPTGILAIGGLLPSQRNDVSAAQIRFQIYIKRLTGEAAAPAACRNADAKHPQQPQNIFSAL